jgi:PAS domain S-box-containing protein
MTQLHEVTTMATESVDDRSQTSSPQHVGGIATDITEQKLAELSLQESKAVFHSLVESLPLNVVRKDLEGRIVFGNQRYCQTVKQPLEELLGKTDHDLFPDALATKYRQDDLRVLDPVRIAGTSRSIRRRTEKRFTLRF